MPYIVTPIRIPDLLILELFSDAPGFIFESFSQQDFNQASYLQPKLSAKDQSGKPLAEAELF